METAEGKAGRGDQAKKIHLAFFDENRFNHRPQ